MPGLDALTSPPTATQAVTPPPAAPPSDKPASPGMFERMIGSIGAGSEVASKKIAALDASTMKMSPPELKLPPKPEPKNDSPIDLWGSMAMAFAALASTRVRNHASTAMNAAAAALDGMKKRDKDAYDQAFQTWQVETKNAIDMANFQQKSYDELLRNVEHKEDLALRIGNEADRATEAKIRTLSQALQDPAMISAMDRDGLKGAVDLQTTRERQAKEFELRKLSMSKAGERAQEALAANVVKDDPKFKEAMAKGDLATAYGMLAEVAPQTFGSMAEKALKDKEDQELKRQKDEELAAAQAKQQYDAWKASPEGQVATPDQSAAKESQIYGSMTARGGKVSAPLSEENRHFRAQQIAAYQEKAPSASSFAVRADPNGWTEVIEEAKKINPDFNEAKYDTVKKARDKITFGKDADAVASYVRLNQHLQFFSDLVDKLSNGSDVKVLDKIAAAWGRQTGNPNVTSYETALQLVGDEMVKAATGTGAAGALGDREEIKKNFDSSLSKEQLRANIDAVRTLVGGAIVSTLNKYRSVLEPQELQTITGLSPEDLESYHVDPKVLQPTVKGPVTFGGRTVHVDEQGSKDVTPAASRSGGSKPIEVKPGEFWILTAPGKGRRVNADGTPYTQGQ